jgi:hypothetical protein
MSQVTHALTMNGRIHGELKDPLDSPEGVIRKRLGLLDGTNRYSLSLWRLPTEVPFDKVDLVHWPQEYIQVAGGGDGMTVEVRRFEGDAPVQYVVGHALGGAEPQPLKTAVLWNGHEARVLESEVFQVDEVVDLFVSYYSTGQVPATYALRPLDR